MAIEIVSSPRDGIADITVDTAVYIDPYNNRTVDVYLPQVKNIHPMWELVQVEFRGLYKRSSRYDWTEVGGIVGGRDIPFANNRVAFDDGFFDNINHATSYPYWKAEYIKFIFRHTQTKRIIAVPSGNIISFGNGLLRDI